MITREVAPGEKVKYNRTVTHPLQSWQWGEFRKKTGVELIRLGKFDGEKLIEAYQLTIHPLPVSSYTIGYLPKGPFPDEEMLSALEQLGKKYNCIFIKLEPNVRKLEVRSQKSEVEVKDHKLTIGNYTLTKSPHPLFPKYTFQIDLTRPKDELLEQMHSKTRYNLRLAKRKGVTVVKDNADEAFKTYLRLMFETTKRQDFYAHDENYHRLMWETLGPKSNNGPIAHLLTAKYKDEILVAWILFLFNHVLYYPYGASSSKHRNVMASNLMMWEAGLWGKKHGAKVFDLWGCLGPDPDKNDPWYGFHRFKKGYGPKLVEFIGSWDLVLNPLMYKIYNAAHKIRWLWLQRR